MRDAIELVLASQAPAPAGREEPPRTPNQAELAADAPRSAELPTAAALERASEAVAALPPEVLKRELLRVLEATRAEAERRRRAEAKESGEDAGDGGGGGDGASEEGGGDASAADADSPLWKPSRQTLAASDSLERLCEAIPAEMRVALDTLTFRRRIGAGAGGFTYAADFQGGQVAVKMASGGKEALVQWQNEARTFAKLSHPNIVRLVGMVERPTRTLAPARTPTRTPTPIPTPTPTPTLTLTPTLTPALNPTLTLALTLTLTLSCASRSASSASPRVTRSPRGS